MAAETYSFIDIAALPGVRERFAAGEALLLLSPDLAAVLWVNGPGAALFAGSDIDTLTDGPSPLGTVARRQIAALPGFPALGEGRGVAVRVATGVTSRILACHVRAVALPDGASSVLLAAPAGEPGTNRAIAGIAQPGQFAAMLDGEGNVAFASPGFADLQLSPRIAKLLVTEAASRPEGLVKRKIETAGRVLPAGLAHLTGDANLLIVVDEGFAAPGDDVFPPDEVEAFEADAGEAALIADAPDSEAAQPQAGVEVLLPEAVEEDWYFNGAGNGLAQSQDRLAELSRSAPVRFSWRTDPDARFTAVSADFLDAVELTEREVIGQRWSDLAERFGFDRDGGISMRLAGRDTWSGSTVLWPLAYSQLAVPVDFAALPTFSRARAFEGFRGFGVARLADAVMRPDEEPLPAEEATVEDEGFSQASPASEHPAETPPPPSPSLKDQSDQVVRLLSEHRQPATERGLSPTERNAFREIGKRLKDVEPRPSAPAEPPSPMPTLVTRAEPFPAQQGVGESEQNRIEADDVTDVRDFATDAVSEASHAEPYVNETTEREAASEASVDVQLPAKSPVATHAEEAMPQVADWRLDKSPETAATVDAEDLIEASDPAEALEPASGTTEPEQAERDHDGFVSDAIAEEGASGADTDLSPAGPAEAPAESAAPAQPEAAEAQSPSELATEATEPDAAASHDEADFSSFYSEPEPLAEEVAPETADLTPAAPAEQPAEPHAMAGEIVGPDPASSTAEPTPDPIERHEAASAGAGETAVEAETPATASWPQWRSAEPEAPPVADIRLPEPPHTPAPAEQPAADAPAPGEPAIAPQTAVLEELPVPLLVHAGDRLHYANPEFLALAGYPSLDAFAEAGGLGALFGEPPSEAGDNRLRLRSGSGGSRPVETLLRSVPWADGKALLLMLRPVEEDAPAREGSPAPREDAEARLAELRAIVDTATDGVVVIAPDLTVRSLSRPAEALFGMDSADVAGKPFGALFAAESQRTVADYLDGLADNGVASVLNDGREVIGREKSGGAIPLFMTIGTLPEKNGFCAVLRDITQWKRAEEELTQSRALAERASSHKTEFLARVSHEIRTPLNAIIGFSELMLDEKFGAIGSDRYRDYLRDINRSGNHVLALVNDLLDISKIEAGQQEMTYEAVSLNDALTETVATMQPQANRERVIIRSSLGPDLPEVVADRRSVRQIALNILSNAIRFTPAGGQVIVSTAVESSGDVVLRVRDTGIGMSQGEIEQALKPFKQINSLKHSRTDGTGLGLPLTKAMVEANRARFAIASTPGEGTLVEVVFPSTRVLA